MDGYKSVSQQLVEHFVNPAQEVGGDARLSMPSDRNIKILDVQRDGLVSLLAALIKHLSNGHVLAWSTVLVLALFTI